MDKSYFSSSTFFVANSVDYFLQFNDKTFGGFLLKHVAARLVAIALIIFSILDAVFHFMMIPLETLRGRIGEIKNRFLLSAQFLLIALATPLEVAQPDILTQPLINHRCSVHAYLGNDITGLNPTRLVKIFTPKTEEELKSIVLEAQKNKWKICIGGQKHSQGGHQFCENGVYIDMRKFNQILDLNLEKKTITVQTGSTWEDIQDYIHPKGLAIKVMQASNIFTVGGSLSTNVHGWDPRFGSLIETIKSMRLLMSDGTIRRVSRTENSDLFRLTLGGYGLMGIILDAEIELTDNVVYEKSARVLLANEYKKYFLENVNNQSEIGLHYARFSMNFSEKLNKLIVVDYRKTNENINNLPVLGKEEHIQRNQFLFHLYRRSSLVRNFRWPIERKRETRAHLISRNHVMRPEVKFLEYHCSRDADILQEYFVPVEHFETFTHRLHQIVEREKINLLNVTVRFVKGNSDSYFPYATKDCFAFVLYINQKTSPSELRKAKIWTQKITEEALDLGGSYYLPYQQWHTEQQFVRAYPYFEEFIERKKKYDPQNLFHSNFYETCLRKWKTAQSGLQVSTEISA